MYQKFKKGRRCSHCSNKHKEYTGHTDWNYNLVKEYLEYDNYELLSEDYKNTKTKILVKCPKGHEIDIYFSHFVKGHRCRICSYENKSKAQRHKESYIDKLLEKEGYKRIGEYINFHSPMLVKCDNGHETYIYLSNFTRGIRCKYCHYSSLEKKFIDYFDKVKVIYDREVRVENDNKEVMIFDFIVFDKNSNIKYILEVDGRHHTEEVEIFGTPLEVYKERDERKNKYCIDRDILLYRIPHSSLGVDEVGVLFNKDYYPLNKFKVKL